MKLLTKSIYNVAKKLHEIHCSVPASWNKTAAWNLIVTKLHYGIASSSCLFKIHLNIICNSACVLHNSYSKIVLAV